jgi:hypothetical protein
MKKYGNHHIDEHRTAEDIASALIARHLDTAGISNSAELARKIVGDFRTGAPSLIIMQQGRLQRLLDQFERLLNDLKDSDNPKQ